MEAASLLEDVHSIGRRCLKYDKVGWKYLCRLNTEVKKWSANAERFLEQKDSEIFLQQKGSERFKQRDYSDQIWGNDAVDARVEERLRRRRFLKIEPILAVLQQHVEGYSQYVRHFGEVVKQLRADGPSFWCSYTPNTGHPFEVFTGEGMWKATRDAATVAAQHRLLSNNTLDRLLEKSHRCQYRRTYTDNSENTSLFAAKSPLYTLEFDRRWPRSPLASRSEALEISQKCFYRAQQDSHFKESLVLQLTESLPAIPTSEYTRLCASSLAEWEDGVWMESLLFELDSIKHFLSFTRRELRPFNQIVSTI